jgi:hypothetical protein
VEQGGTHGTDDLQIKVYAPDESFLQDININSEDPIDTEYTLDNNLVLTLGAGDLLTNTTFTVDVNDAVGSAVDPSKAMNGTRGDDPDLEYGQSVTDGSFDINGETITVNAGDSINDVLDRITSSDAGVTATFDAETESVVLTQKTAGSDNNITLQNDTSGFLAATKLSGAEQVSGADGDPDKALADVSEFSSIQNGSITVNGEDISIDVNADSLNDVIDRINASQDGVVAGLDDSMQSVTLTAVDTDDQIVISGGETGFFSALQIAEGTHNGTPGGLVKHDGLSDLEAREVAYKVDDAARAINNIFSDLKLDSDYNDILSRLQDTIQSTLSGTFGSSGSDTGTDIGMNFNFKEGTREVMDYSHADLEKLTSRLTKDFDNVNALFLGEEDVRAGGFITELKSALEGIESELKTQFNSMGLFVNVQV